MGSPRLLPKNQSITYADPAPCTERRAGGSGPTEDEELFDVSLEDVSKSDSRNGTDGRRQPGAGPTSKRQKKDQRFGFGGKKRFAKSGDAVSSGDIGGFSVNKMKGQKRGVTKRLGKSRRAAKESRK